MKKYIVTLLALVLLASCQTKQDQQTTDKSVPDFLFDKADSTLKAKILGGSLEYDADVVSLKSDLWYAWLEFTPGKGDMIWVGVRDGSNWEKRQCVTREPGEYARPTLTIDAVGNLWLSYEARSSDQWDVYIVRLEDGKPVTEVRPVSNSSGADIHHRTAVTNEGLWIVWQSDRGGRFKIVALLFANNQKNNLQIISENTTGNWHPCITSDTLGNVHIAWDSYDGEAFNVRLRSYRNGKWEETIDVTNSSAFEGRTDIVADHQDRVWIVWEEGGQNWGKPYRGVRTKQDIGPLHRFRLIQMALLASDGTIQVMDDPIPMPAVTKARKREKLQPNCEKVGAFYERSRLSVDRFGRLWVFYRHFYTPWLGVTPRYHVEKEWGLYARCYTGEGWSSLKKMSLGQGDGLQRLELASHDNGVAAVWTTGKTRRHDNKPPRGLMTAMVTTPVRKAGNPPLKQLEISKSRKKDFLIKNTESVTIGNKNYYLFYGDLHRHTDLSLCRMPTDGTLDDAYRYAIEVAKLDFMGITDHSRDIALGNHLSQLWWRNRKAVYRYQLLDNDKMHFVPFYAYERSHEKTADHNVISLRGDMLRPHTYPLPQFWDELDRDTITIPHIPIHPETWDYQDDSLRPLVEIFQGGRNKSIEEHVHQGLLKGYHLGFIASSDHMSTSASYACVWAEDSTRESIFRALQSRRTFAATDKIWLMFQSGDHLMGEIIEPSSKTQLKLEVRGTAPIQSINLILDGEINKTWSPNKRSITLDITLDSTDKHYAYFHLVQIDGNEAWSSPIWFDDVDNCPDTWNAEQLDADTDSIGDVYDGTPGCGGRGQDLCEKSLTDKIEELLTHYYWNILGRTPDSGGLNYWTGEIMSLVSSGGDIKEDFISMAQAYFYSQEYLDRDRGDVEYVTDLYNTFFDRGPDQGGLAYWTGQLAQGASRSTVLDHFVYSAEFNDFMEELFGLS